jgi:hypothetical protein
MIRKAKVVLVSVLISVGATDTLASEEASYEVVKKSNHFEIRDYEPHIVAETVVDGTLEEAGSGAFRILFDYISGGNRSRKKVEMTAPVSQQPGGEPIAMTAPVGQQRLPGDKWAVSFMMPRAYTMETLPEPINPKVTLRQVPGRRIAAVRYSGFWSAKGYLRNKLKLEQWIEENGFKAVGEPIWARYNSPFTPWFLRRNEILMPISTEFGNESYQVPMGVTQTELLGRVAQ